MSDNLFVSRIKAGLIDLTIIWVLWTVVWAVVGGIAFFSIYYVKRDISTFFEVTGALAGIFAILFLPILLIFLRDKKLPGYKKTGLQLRNCYTHELANDKQRIIKLLPILIVSVLLGLAEGFIVEEYGLDGYFVSPKGARFFMVYLCFQIPLYTTYFVFYVIELITGNNLPNRIARLEVMYKNTEIEL